eukprot:1178247-Prorocentrum_minimum.AAC.5
MPIAAFISSTKDVYVEVVAIDEDNEIASFSSSTKDDVILKKKVRALPLPCSTRTPQAQNFRKARASATRTMYSLAT